MAKQALKKKTTALPRNFDASKIRVGVEPTWVEDAEVTRSELLRAFNWYNYFNDNKSAAKMFFAHFLGTKQEMVALKTLNIKYIPPILGTMSRMIYLGCKFQDTELNTFDRIYKETLQLVGNVLDDDVEEDKPVKFKLTIQQRTQNKMASKLGVVEGIIDEFMTNGYKLKTKFAMYTWLQEQEIKPLQSKQIAALYEPMATELEEALAGTDEDLNEGYGHISKPQMKRLVAFVRSLVDDATLWASNGKSVRKPRTKKSVPATKQIDKLSYCKADNDLKIVSVKPESILGAQELWVFNTKYRKLIKYVASDRGGFSVKGTTLQNWDETKSISKTVKKPEEVLPRLLKGGKIVLKKLMDELNTKPAPMTGRINNNTVLLRVIK
jgi:hypothetical protein